MGHLKIIINFDSGIFFLHDFVYQIESSNSPKYICLSLAADRTEKKKKKDETHILREFTHRILSHGVIILFELGIISTQYF